MNKKVIDRIYIGLPNELISQVFWVERPYRTHLLSHEPGGSDIIIKFQTSEVFGYDWVKFPYLYIQSIFENTTQISKVEFENFASSKKLKHVKSLFQKIYLRTWKGNKDYEKASFTEIWNSDHSNQIPWIEAESEILEKYPKRTIPSDLDVSKTMRQSFKSKFPSISPEISWKISWKKNLNKVGTFEVDKNIFLVHNVSKDYYYACAIIDNRKHYFHFTSPESNKEKILSIKSGDKLHLKKIISDSYWSGMARNQKNINAGDENYFIEFSSELDDLPF